MSQGSVPFIAGITLAKAIIKDIPQGTEARVVSAAGAFLLVATLVQLGSTKATALALVADMWDGVEAQRSTAS